MNSARGRWLAGAAAVVATGGLAALATLRGSADSDAVPVAVPPTPQPSAGPHAGEPHDSIGREAGAQDQTAAPSNARPDPSGHESEAQLMARLRDLGFVAPELSLRLAREGNARYPSTPDAAERAWIVTKSLASLKRFHEARNEAQRMKELYPGTGWTLDAERHLLVYPLDQPSREERQRRTRERDATR